MTDYAPDAHVLAVDVAPSHAHIARVYRDGRTPQVTMIRFPELDEARDSNVTRSVQIAETNAKKVVGEVMRDTLAGGTGPTLVVMSKLMLFDAKTDPSGARRAALWWYVARMVQEMHAVAVDTLTLAECAPMTAQKVVTSRAVPGRQGFADTARGLRALYPILAETAPEGFRWYVIGEALAGAVTLGWSTPCNVDRAALTSLAGRSNSFPDAIPKTPEEWDKLNAEHRAVYKKGKEKVA